MMVVTTVWQLRAGKASDTEALQVVKVGDCLKRPFYFSSVRERGGQFLVPVHEVEAGD